ncbi:alpha-L-rhamnosidase-related protein [Lederbergia citri]|uniref:Alpha-L-rhamnosidase N-terminal domain-containing protein n=1 Tax=Lederbergia citri TaxID=2833580 RepID=A0A942YK49_9BACI|nr:alpha-L-rhamnosidase N-terminal domain-containing protein [Lederbergia citri]MBS4197001.1 alpha-L-rhamnosidase N-terminal domain-containing protein [Lederbergia citri]
MAQHWEAKWIWSHLPENTPNVYCEFRKMFTVDEEVDISSANLSISANQEYILFMNGERIGRGPSPSDNSWKYYDTYEVAANLHKGQNTIAVLVYNFGTTEIVTQQFQGPGGLIAQLEIETNKKNTIIPTDCTWKCRQSPRWVQDVSRQHNWNGYREIYLAQEEDGWETSKYDDTNWNQAQEIANALDTSSVWPHLIKREIPFLHQELITPKSVFHKEDNLGVIDIQGNIGESRIIIDASIPGSLPALVYDFSKEVVGYPHLEVLAPLGGVILLYYGESLDLTLYDTFILKKGRNELSPFGRRAFRYMKIAVQATPEPITLDNLHLNFVHYPFVSQGTFKSSDALLNQIWETGKYTTQINSQDHLEDTPLREKALWVVDELIMGKVIYHVFGDHRLLRKCLLQGARIQNEDGSIPGTGPERNDMMLPDFCAHWLFGVYDYWNFTNDMDFLKQLWPNIKRLLDWFKKNEAEDGLFTIEGKNYWCFIDWAEYIDRRDKVTALSCYYYKVLLLSAELAAIIEDKTATVEWIKKANALKKQIHLTMWSDYHQAYVDCVKGEEHSNSITYQTNFVAMWSGIMSDYHADYFIKEYFLKRKAPELKGPFFYFIVLEELFNRNYSFEAVDRIREYWGEMINRGATTWWEAFDPNSANCTIPSPYQGHTPTYLRDYIPVSQCHGWGSSPTYLMTQHILGVNVSQLGDKKVTLKPLTNNLNWARGTIPTRIGVIKVDWKKKGERINFQIEIPEGLHWEGTFSPEIDVQVNGILLGEKVK